VQRRSGHVRLHAYRHGHPGGRDAAVLLARDEREEMVGPFATVGRVVFQAEQAELGQAGEEFVGGEPAFSLPLIDVRIDLLVDQTAYGRSEGLVLISQSHGGSITQGANSGGCSGLGAAPSSESSTFLS